MDPEAAASMPAACPERERASSVGAPPGTDEVFSLVFA